MFSELSEASKRNPMFSEFRLTPKPFANHWTRRSTRPAVQSHLDAIDRASRRLPRLARRFAAASAREAPIECNDAPQEIGCAAGMADCFLKRRDLRDPCCHRVDTQSAAVHVYVAPAIDDMSQPCAYGIFSDVIAVVQVLDAPTGKAPPDITVCDGHPESAVRCFEKLAYLFDRPSDVARPMPGSGVGEFGLCFVPSAFDTQTKIELSKANAQCVRVSRQRPPFVAAPEFMNCGRRRGS